jgi:hypothetical protein
MPRPERQRFDCGPFMEKFDQVMFEQPLFAEIYVVI